jgi:quinol monooxygenase YgiN
MVTVGLLARMEARPGKEDAVRDLLTSALALAQEEAPTTVWFAIQMGPSSFGIFDAFADDSGRQAHLQGRAPVGAARHPAGGHPGGQDPRLTPGADQAGAATREPRQPFPAWAVDGSGRSAGHARSLLIGHSSISTDHLTGVACFRDHPPVEES